MPNKRHPTNKAPYHHKVPLKPSLSRTLSLSIIVALHILLLVALASGVITHSTVNGNLNAKTTTIDFDIPDAVHADRRRLDTISFQVEELVKNAVRSEGAEDSCEDEGGLALWEVDMDNGIGREMRSIVEEGSMIEITTSSAHVGGV